MLSSALLAAALTVMPDMSAPDTAGGMLQATIGAGIEEKLGARVDSSLTFIDEYGREVRLGEYLVKGRPVILNFSYFHCPMLCGLVQDGMAKALKGLDRTPGKDYEILTVSMDWREGPEQAMPVKERIVPLLEKPDAEKGWAFLTGEYKTVRTLARSVGFNYNFVPGQNDFAHGAGLIFLSPTGVVSRYLYGIEFSQRDLRLALLDASEEKSLSIGEKFALMCFQYDPHAQGYVLFARNFMKAGGLVVLALLLLLLIPLWRKEARNARRRPASPTGKEA